MNGFETSTTKALNDGITEAGLLAFERSREVCRDMVVNFIVVQAVREKCTSSVAQFSGRIRCIADSTVPLHS